MKGFLYKDLAIFRGVIKSYLFVAALFLALTVVDLYDPSFLFMMLALVVGMFPSTSFSYDELAKWDRFAISVPGGRRKVVQGKYATAILLSLGILAVDLLASSLLVLLGKGELMNFAFLCVGGVAGALILNAVMIPLLFKFGAQKGRIMLIAAAALASGTVGVGLAIGGLASFGAGVFSSYILLAVPVIAIAALAASYFISLGIYRKREF